MSPCLDHRVFLPFLGAFSSKYVVYFLLESVNAKSKVVCFRRCILYILQTQSSIKIRQVPGIVMSPIRATCCECSSMEAFAVCMMYSLQDLLLRQIQLIISCTRGMVSIKRTPGRLLSFYRTSYCNKFRCYKYFVNILIVIAYAKLVCCILNNEVTQSDGFLICRSRPSAVS